MRSKAATLILFFTTALLNATQVLPQEKPYDGPIYIQPSSGYLPLKVIHKEEIIDGNPSTYTQLVCPLFTGQSSACDAWMKKAQNSSVTLTHQLVSNRSVVIYIWPKEKAYLPDLSNESMTGFVEGLKQKYKETVSIISEPNSFFPKYGIYSPMNAETKMVSYKLTNTSKKIDFQINHYFLFTKNAFIEFLIRAPEKDIMVTTKSISHFLNGMSDQI